MHTDRMHFPHQPLLFPIFMNVKVALIGGRDKCNVQLGKSSRRRCPHPPSRWGNITLARWNSRPREGGRSCYSLGLRSKAAHYSCGKCVFLIRWRCWAATFDTPSNRIRVTIHVKVRLYLSSLPILRLWYRVSSSYRRSRVQSYLRLTSFGP